MAAKHPSMLLLVLLLHLHSWTADPVFAAIGEGQSIGEATPGGTPWRDIVSQHLCPLIACENWCDCSDVGSTVVLGQHKVNLTSPTCTNETNSNAGKLLKYTDCTNLMDRACFKWKPFGPGGQNPTDECMPTENMLTCVRRVGSTTGSSLRWEVCLTSGQCLNVSELCGDTAPSKDSCDLCARDVTTTSDDSSARLPGLASGTTLPGGGGGGGGGGGLATHPTVSESGSKGNSSENLGDVGGIPDELRTAFIIGVGVGVGVAVLSFIFVCCLVIYIRRKMNRNVHDDQQPNRTNFPVDGNQYSTIERPIYTRANGDARAIFTISPQTSIDSGSPTMNKKLKKKNNKLWSSKSLKNTTAAPMATASGPYTEYYADRSTSSYAGLQPVASDSVLLSRGVRHSGARTFDVFSEYQEPDHVMPKTCGLFMFDDKRLSNSSSFTSFKLPGEYIDPEEINGSASKKQQDVAKGREQTPTGGSSGISPNSTLSKHFKQKCDDNTTSPTSSKWHGLRKGKQKKPTDSASCKDLTSSSSRQCLGSPDGKEGTLFNELVETLNKKKKPVSKSESTPPDIEAENPYAEVGEALLGSYPDIPLGRQRSHSQPMISTLPGYRTYEEIKPRLDGKRGENGEDHSVFTDAYPAYFVLEDANTTSTRQYFELENLNEDTSHQHYFELEKPGSLPLDKKNNKRRSINIELQDFTNQQDKKMATLYQNDKCAVKGSGFRSQQFDLCVDSDSRHLNGIAVRAPAYFQLERPRERASLGSTVQEYMSSSETLYAARDRNSRGIEETLPFYPGGRKRSSTYSLEEQAYDRLNRSARSSRTSSSRRSTLTNGIPHSASHDGPYAVLSPTGEYGPEYSQPDRVTASKNKGVRKK